MMNETKSLPQTKCPHTHLTHLLRRRQMVSRSDIYFDLYRRCDLPIFVGELPRGLRERVARDEIAAVTVRFDEIIQDFISKNFKQLVRTTTNKIYELPELGRLFGTECVAECNNEVWSGSFGNVLRISFDGVPQKYALKVFRASGLYHGAAFEIPTAFAANRAEARDNVPVHIASVRGRTLRGKYMLSDWCDDDSFCADYRDNKNIIYDTAADEEMPRNYGNGRRLDFGKTHLTPYGRASYAVRKIYRRVADMARSNDVDALCRMIDDARSYVARADMTAAFRLADIKIRESNAVMDIVRGKAGR